MTSMENEEPKVASLSHVMAHFVEDRLVNESAAAAMTDFLMQREDQIAETLRVAGSQFGLFPEIVAEVLTEIGIGTPPDDTTREFIKQNFIARMQWIQQQQQPPGV